MGFFSKSSPSRKMAPASGMFSPHREIKEWNFPQPEGPTMAINSPVSTLKEISERASDFPVFTMVGKADPGKPAIWVS